MIFRRTPGLLIALICCCLLAVGPALARQSGDPPVPGNQFEGLLGMHRDSPRLVALLKWARFWPLDAGQNSTSGGGLSIKFENDRVSEIGLTIRSSTEPTWAKSLPFGLNYKTKSSSLRDRKEWSLYSGNSTFRVQMSRSFGDRQFTGIGGKAVFNSLGKL